MSDADAFTARVFEFIEHCDAMRDVDQLASAFSALTSGLGFRHFVLTRIPAVDAHIETVILLSTYPPAWQRRYRERGYQFIDPVSRYSAIASQPFMWGEAIARFPPNGAVLALMGEAAAHGLIDGFVTPMVDPDSFQAVVALAAGRPLALTAKQKALLALASVQFKMAFDEITAAARRSERVQLSAREAEVLSWIAVGKTQLDIATILSISERTVEAHLTNIRRKLDVTTTAQAVAKAIKQRIIVPYFYTTYCTSESVIARPGANARQSGVFPVWFRFGAPA